MAVKDRVFAIKTLRGDEVREGIKFSSGMVTVEDARWGYSPVTRPIAVSESEEDIKSGKVVLTSIGVPVLVESEAWVTDEDVVLVQEYEPGTGAKRWPGFAIDWETFPEVKVLARDSAYKGSGGETWSLVLAPRGWAEYVADSFENRRDMPRQTIAAPS